MTTISLLAFIFGKGCAAQLAHFCPCGLDISAGIPGSEKLVVPLSPCPKLGQNSYQSLLGVNPGSENHCQWALFITSQTQRHLQRPTPHLAVPFPLVFPPQLMATNVHHLSQVGTFPLYTLCVFFFFKVYVSLLERQSNRQRKREISSILQCTPQMATKARVRHGRAWNSTLLSPRSGKDASTQAMLHCLQVCISRKPDQKWSGQDRKQLSTLGGRHPGQCSTRQHSAHLHAALLKVGDAMLTHPTQETPWAGSSCAPGLGLQS